MVDLDRVAISAAEKAVSGVKSVRVTSYHGFSTDPAILAAVPDDIDLIYLDADHSEAGVDAELAAWVPKLRIGGIVGIHDTVHFAGVCRAGNRVAAAYPAVTLATGRGCGLTLVRRDR